MAASPAASQLPVSGFKCHGRRAGEPIWRSVDSVPLSESDSSESSKPTSEAHTSTDLLAAHWQRLAGPAV
jgi:hypothetical protein